MSDWAVRTTDPAETDAIVDLWHRGWHDGHAGLVPDDLTARRSRDDFAARWPALAPHARTVGPIGAPLCLCVVLGDDLNQFYVDTGARGTGLAARLLADGESRIAQAGFETARLDVVIENTRAQRFYAKCGWQDAGDTLVALKTMSGPYEIELRRMTKSLAPAA
ncbi:MAG: GNAT family N-acetyltransferase [Pseudomonadota bacterium]